MRPVLECMFSCSLCGAEKVQFGVPVRSSEQSVDDWMNNTFTPAMVDAHKAVSPNCRPEKMAEVYIPTSEVGVGFLP